MRTPTLPRRLIGTVAAGAVSPDRLRGGHAGPDQRGRGQLAPDQLARPLAEGQLAVELASPTRRSKGAKSAEQLVKSSVKFDSVCVRQTVSRSSIGSRDT